MTFIKIRSRDADTPARWIGAMVTTLIGTDLVINFGAPSIDDLGLGSGTQLTTPAGVTGWYVIDIGLVPDTANIEHYDYRLWVAGAQVRTASRSYNTNGTPISGDSGATRHTWSGVIGPSQAIQLRATSPSGAHYLNSGGAGSVEITFVPTPNHRYT